MYHSSVLRSMWLMLALAMTSAGFANAVISTTVEGEANAVGDVFTVGVAVSSNDDPSAIPQSVLLQVEWPEDALNLVEFTDGNFLDNIGDTTTRKTTSPFIIQYSSPFVLNNPTPTLGTFQFEVLNASAAPFSVTLSPVGDDDILLDALGNSIPTVLDFSATAALGTAPGLLTVSDSSFTVFSDQDCAVKTETVVLGNAGGLDLDLIVSSDSGWLTVSPDTLNIAADTTTSLTLIVDTCEIPVGTYTAFLTIEDQNSGETLDTIEVTLRVPEDGYVRFVHLSPDAGDVTVFLNGMPVVSDANFTSATMFLNVKPGTVFIELIPSTGPLAGLRLVGSDWSVPEGAYLTFVALGRVSDSTIDLHSYSDLDPFDTYSSASVRGIHGFNGVPTVDVVLVDESGAGSVLFGALNYTDSSSFASVPTGDYTLGVDLNGDASPELVFETASIEANAPVTAVVAENQSGDPFLFVVVGDGNTASLNIVPGTLEVQPTQFATSVTVGQNAAPTSFEIVQTSGSATSFTITSSESWLSTAFTTGALTTGRSLIVPVEFDVAGFGAGEYLAFLTVESDSGAAVDFFVSVSVNPVSEAFLRLAHLSPDAGPVDVRINGLTVLSGVQFTDSTTYLAVNPGNVFVDVILTTGTLAGASVGQNLTLESGEYYTGLAIGKVGNGTVRLAAYGDLDPAADYANAPIRSIHGIFGAPTVEVVAVAGNGLGVSLFAPLNFPQASGFVNLPVSGYTLGGDFNGDLSPELVFESVNITEAAPITAVVAESEAGEPFLFVMLQNGAATILNTVPGNLGVEPAVLNVTALSGVNPTDISFDVVHLGGSSVEYSISGGAPWVSTTATATTLTSGLRNTIALDFDVADLEVGEYTAEFIVNGAAASLPATVTVNLSITPPEPAFLRAAHLSPDAGPVTVFLNGVPVLNDVLFTSSTGYLPITAGEVLFEVFLTTGNLAGARLSTVLDLPPGSYTTVLALGRATDSSLTLQAYGDISPFDVTTDARVRGIHGFEGVPTVDVLVVGEDGLGSVLFDNLTFPGTSSFVNVPVGVYTLGVDLNGDLSPELVFDPAPIGAPVPVTAVVAENEAGAPFVFVMLPDGTAASLNLVPGSIEADVNQIDRSVLAGGDAGSASIEVVHLGGSVVNLSTSTTADWLTATAFPSALTSGLTSNVVVDFETANLAAGDYSAQVVITSDAGQEFTVDVSLSVAPTAFLRAAHLSPDAGTVTVFLDGVPVLSDVNFTSATSFLTIPAGEVLFEVSPTTGALAGARLGITIDSLPNAYTTVLALGRVSDETITLQSYSDTSPSLITADAIYSTVHGIAGLGPVSIRTLGADGLRPSAPLTIDFTEIASSDTERRVTFLGVDVDLDERVDLVFEPIDLTSTSPVFSVVAAGQDGVPFVFAMLPDGSSRSLGILPATIEVSPLLIETDVIAGANAAEASIIIAQRGGSSVNVAVASDAEWVTPVASTSVSLTFFENATAPLVFSTADLAPGNYETTITISGEAVGLPAEVLVRLNVLESNSSRIVFDFADGPSGWVFDSPVFELPGIGVTDAAQGIFNGDGAGALELITSSNQSFAFWTSPRFRVTPLLSEVGEGELGIAGIAGAEGLFRVVATIASNVENRAEVPTFRIRTSSWDWQQSDILVITSYDEIRPDVISLIPDSEGVEYTKFFTLPAGVDSFRIDFDVANFDPLDAADATLSLLDLDLAALSAANFPPASPRVALDLTEGNPGFTTFTLPEIYGEPSFFETELGLAIVGRDANLAKNDDPVFESAIDFGSWELDASETPFEANTIYRISYTVASSATDASTVPTFRFRVNSSSFALAAMMNINSSDENSNVPTQGNPVTYTMYLRTPAAIVGDTWRFAFDYIFTEVTGDDRAAALYLQNLTVEAIPEI